MSSGDRQRAPAVLLVEDDRATRVMLAHVLQTAGYAVLEAGDGREALAVLGDPPETERIDLVVSDVRMPGMNGMELARVLREADPGLPVVLLTSFGEKEVIKDALRLGVREFIEKPVDPGFLHETLKRLLAESADRAQPRREAAETVAAVRKAQDTLSAQTWHGWPIFSHLEPCHPAGGDIFRVFTRSRGGCVFILADVTGHSVESSYAVAAFLGTLAACGIDREDYRELFAEMNRAIAQSPFCEIPVCALLGFWAPHTGRLHIVNAGLPHGWLHRVRRGAVQRLALDGTPLGLFAEPLVEERAVLLEAGDRLVFGTDGLFDAPDRGGVRFEAQVDGIIADRAARPPDELPAALCRMARAHQAGAQQDDMLAVVLEQPDLALESSEVLALHLASTFDAVDRACQKLEEFLGRLARSGACNPERFEVASAVREALLNAVIHGNGRAPMRQAGLLCEVLAGGSGLSVSVFDEGCGFDPGMQDAHDIPLREGNRGMALMKRFARSVHVLPGETRLEFSG